MSELNSATFDYVDKNISHHLKCEICKLPVYDGIYHSYCRHFRCKECNNTSYSCNIVPHFCDKPDDIWYPMINDEFMSQMLDNLQIYCTNKKNGCLEAIPRAKYFEHLNVCDYNLIKCQNCEIEIKKMNFERHINTECPKRVITCQYCSVSGSVEVIQKHLTDISLCQGLDKVLLFLEHPMVISVLEKTLGKRKFSEPPENSRSKKSKNQQNIIKYLEHPINLFSENSNTFVSLDDLIKVVGRPSEEIIIENLKIRFIYGKNSTRYLSKYHLYRWIDTLPDNDYKNWIQNTLIPFLSDVNEVNEVNEESLSDDEKIDVENSENELQNENMINFPVNYDIKNICTIVENFLKILYQENKNLIIGKDRESIINYIKKHLNHQILKFWNVKKSEGSRVFYKLFYNGIAKSKYKFENRKCKFKT